MGHRAAEDKQDDEKQRLDRKEQTVHEDSTQEQQEMVSASRKNL